MTGLREKRGRDKIDRPTDDRCKREEEDERRNKRDSPTDDRCKGEEERIKELVRCKRYEEEEGIQEIVPQMTGVRERRKE